MTLDTGDDAPTVEAQNQRGETVELDFDEPTVLYFYPRDDTPGCTTEAEQFDRELESYRDAGVSVFGVSTDDVESHEQFAEKYEIRFDLLADPDAEIAEAFGVDVDSARGAASRTTFVLADGEVKAVYEGVDPDGHARDVLGDMLDEDLVVLE
ncbi:peroxiredoxin [Halorussus sp. AFM4]|uniref:peroxiredoxin n=1 Tax=Halorussus sp. AFM4 TaxID=3421651 RepID=UPI003EB72179